jgi:hypothetical protein
LGEGGEGLGRGLGVEASGAGGEVEGGCDECEGEECFHRIL